MVCHGCIGDGYLKAEIRKDGVTGTCLACGKRRKAIPLDDLCERVHEAMTEEYQRTASEPESWELYKESDYDWERDGDDVETILHALLQCDDALIGTLKERLSDLNHSFDDAAMGEEDPYGDDVRYTERKPNDWEFTDAWSSFEDEIRTKARFFSRTAEDVLGSIFEGLNRFRTLNDRVLIRDVGPDVETRVLYRARRALSEPEIAQIVERPARELGPPPSRAAGSGRMNPRWIPMFYGAFDSDTCVAEVRAPVGSSVVIGKFEIVRPLRLLDLDAFQHLLPENGSPFDPGLRRLRDRARFLKRLVWIMSRPVMPNDEDYQYLPTQAVAEYLAEKTDPKLDGLIFPSSQRGGRGENVVLFRHASTVEKDAIPDDVELSTSFGWTSEDHEDRDITVWEKKKPKAAAEANRPEFSPFEDAWPDLRQPAEEPATLRLVADEIEVRDIHAVEYRTETRRVTRYVEPEGGYPF